jgi:hypothetical protein
LQYCVGNVGVLQKRYRFSASSISTASIYIANIVRFHEDFKFGSTASVEHAWTTLKEYRRTMVQAGKSMESTYRDKGLSLILTQGLPKVYRRAVDGLKTNTSISIKDKIMILRQFEEENRIIQRGSAPIAYGRRQKPYKRHKLNQSGNESENEGCYMCGNEEHYTRDSDLNEEIFEFGKKLRAKYNEPNFTKFSKLKKSPKSKPKDKMKFSKRIEQVRV